MAKTCKKLFADYTLTKQKNHPLICSYKTKDLNNNKTEPV